MIYIAPSLAPLLQAMQANPPQALLLTGPTGRGLTTLARHLAQQWGKLEHVVQPISQKTGSTAAISVEAVRELYSQTKGKSTTRSVVLIDNADAMTLSAQNALLKLLEEPSTNVHFILTSHTPERLLTTVRSRTQHIAVPPISSEQSEQHRSSKVFTVY